jgi:UDP-N-acetylglucosamine 2-epimerase (non-hydrolysing)
MKARRGWEPLFVSTGQHRQMLDQACAVFGITPEIDLNLMQPGQTLPQLTSRVLLAMTRTIEETKPDAILVQGDTTTVLGSALAAFYQKVPIGHVEAGLRTYNYLAPYPEEMNRRLTDPISRWCFAPTEASRANLIAERIPSDIVFVTGNTVIDALLFVRDKTRAERSHAAMIGECGIRTDFAAQFLPDPSARGAKRRLILVTGHRRESFGSGFESICNSIRQLVERYPDVGVVYPVHLNPNVQEPVNRLLGNHPRIHLIKPLSYEPFVWLMGQAHFILSDSGGVQEEAPSLGKPVLVMRETTERPEGVDAGTCRLVGTDPAKILGEAAALLDDCTQK